MSNVVDLRKGQPPVEGETATQFTLDTLQLPLDQVHPNPLNVRSDLGDLTDLARSIEQLGVQTPILVHPDGNGGWTIIYGHRRHGASILAGVATIPAVVRTEPDEVELIELQVAENLQRAGLDPIDEAKAILRLRSAGGARTVAQLAAKLHRSTDWIAGRLKLLDLPEDLWPRVAAREVPLEDAVAVARLSGSADSKRRMLLVDDVAARSVEIRRAVQEQAEAKRRRMLANEYGDLLDVAAFARYRQNHPWGLVRLGDRDGELNVPIALHLSACPGHVAMLTATGEPRAYCAQPLAHLDAGEFPGVSRATLDLTTKTAPVDSIFGDWAARRAHERHAPCHRQARLPWNTTPTPVCVDPKVHTDRRRKDYLPEELLLQRHREDQVGRAPGEPLQDQPAWRVTDDARELITTRAAEQLALLDSAVRDAIAICWCPPERLVDELVVNVVSWLESVARDPGEYEIADDPTAGDDSARPATLLWGYQACVDVGAPPPNLDQIRTRIDVVTKGEEPVR